jgi:regulator of replication initiation timing
MEIFERTIFKKKNLEIKSLQFELLRKESTIKALNKRIDELNSISVETIESLTNDNIELRNKLDKTEKTKRKLLGTAGGLKKYNNRLINENEKLKLTIDLLQKDFDDFRKNKFIVKELKPQKAPKTQKMKIKDCSVQSKIISKIKNEDN